MMHTIIPLEVRISTSALTAATIGTLLLTFFFGICWMHAESRRWLYCILTFVFGICFASVGARRLFNFPVVRISGSTLMFSDQLFPWRTCEIPYSAIISAHYRWTDSSSREDAPTLVLELSNSIECKGYFSDNLDEATRRRFNFPLGNRLVEYSCANCVPGPPIVCERINKWLEYKKADEF